MMCVNFICISSTSSINFVCATSRLIDVVYMCVSNKSCQKKTYVCLVFLPFGKNAIDKEACRR